MTNELILLTISAASIGFFHTLLGPDHYLPFIVLSKARNWPTLKTVMITILCGLGHVGSSVLLGGIGVVFGIALHKLELIESIRGDWAAWAFLIFGLGYLGWAIYKLLNQGVHKHLHVHEGLVHNHEHNHQHSILETSQVPHSHGHTTKTKNLTPWILFLIFVLGPCEPLIPFLMYPAAQASVYGLFAVTGVFALTTIATMVGMVLLINYGVSFINLKKIEKYTHVIAGTTIALSGMLILLGL